MMKVEQIDLFEVLEEIDKQQIAAVTLVLTKPTSATSTPAVRKPRSMKKPFFYWCVNALIWLWHFATSLFGLGIWVNVYTVTRGFGGRENGGWCYLKYECEHAKQVGIWEADALRKNWETQYKISHKWGDLHSKIGGQDVVVLIEKRSAASQTRCKPLFEESAALTFLYSLVK
ncbi:hypothetical protein [Paenibacillus sp. PL91]|uniref:hypothetical protein n=1 Tax=Paenibacillus sp. PL91 TaxID=2729538 RepID=UPI00145D4F34|nr:hypothetical protein [Paenibacillus sp. PL91]MBC9204103.1 hypothetical protein [Paenibacillus sp. PL91]